MAAVGLDVTDMAASGHGAASGLANIVPRRGGAHRPPEAMDQESAGLRGAGRGRRTDPRPCHRRQPLGVRHLLPGCERHLFHKRRPRRRGRPDAPPQAPPPGRGRRDQRRPRPRPSGRLWWRRGWACRPWSPSSSWWSSASMSASRWPTAVWLKNEPVLDLAAVASGFVLRAIAGGGGGRGADLAVVPDRGHLRELVHGDRASASPTWLPLRDGVGATDAGARPGDDRRRSSATAPLSAVGADDQRHRHHHRLLPVGVRKHQGRHRTGTRRLLVPTVDRARSPWPLLRYGLLIDQGHGGAPEDVVLGDRLLLGLGLSGRSCSALGVYR